LCEADTFSCIVWYPSLNRQKKEREKDILVKQFFLVRWFRSWRKQRDVSLAWHMRTLLSVDELRPCKYCPLPIPAESDFCMYCGASQNERQTSGSLPVESLTTEKLDITAELPSYYRPGEKYGHLKAYKRMMKEKEGQE